MDIDLARKPVPSYESIVLVVPLTGDFAAAGGDRNVRITKIGNMVNISISGELTYGASVFSRETSPGFIPSRFVPTVIARNMYATDASSNFNVEVYANGILRFFHHNSSLAPVNRGSCNNGFTITYTI